MKDTDRNIRSREVKNPYTPDPKPGRNSDRRVRKTVRYTERDMRKDKRSNRFALSFLFLFLAVIVMISDRDSKKKTSKTAAASSVAQQKVSEQSASLSSVSQAEPDDSGSSDGTAADDAAAASDAAVLATVEELTEEESREYQKANESASYTMFLDTVMGPMYYYNQTDPQWASYLYGGSDPIKTYGCGPTAVAMIINSFGKTDGSEVTPIDMADWAAKHGEFSKGHGSKHSLIPDAMKAYGLSCSSMQKKLSKEAVQKELQKGHLLVALVGPGYFTETGHFIILLQETDDGRVRIADPNSLENTKKEFSYKFLLDELYDDVTDAGAPLWTIGTK